MGGISGGAGLAHDVLHAGNIVEKGSKYVQVGAGG